MRRLFSLLLLFATACAAPVTRAGAVLNEGPTTRFASEIAAFRATDRAAPPAPCQILFVGSSSIRMWSTLARDMAPHSVINRGFGGSTIADVNQYFSELVTPYRPRAIVFYAGDNDINDGVGAEDVVSAFARFMAMKDAALGETPVYFISLKPSRARWAQIDRQRAVNVAVAAMAAHRADLVFIDIASAMAPAGSPGAFFVEDGLHMNAAGYAIWTEAVNAALAAPAETRAPQC